ncbi:MAG: hypothetical protein J1D86_06705 [Alistipes sp.]|nr:hypothetical protein [Alistipes sp.]
MKYSDVFEVEFIERTKAIIDGYNTPFENTLFINACVGLLILPEQRLYNHLPKDVVSEKDWGISPDTIKVEKNKDVQNTARHIRNAISHNGVLFASENGVDITHVRITDYKDYNHTTESFRMEIPVDKFKKFVMTFAQFALDNKHLFGPK